MIFLRRLLVPTLLCAAVIVPAAAAKSRPTRPAESGPAYKGAIIMDAATGNVLFEDHDGESSPPASMTKLMTFAVLHDKLAAGALTLQTPITVTAADSKIGGTQVWLKENEVFTVEELIYAVMIQSANDAAHALARTAGGSVPAFVELMNAKARELGMTHTTFRTPHGLPPSNRRIAEGDLTTPHDFALLCRYLLLKTDVIKYTSVKRRAFGPPARGTMMDNHDHLLGRVEGVDGLKTGFTNGAGFCLSATALRNGRRIIVARQRNLTHQRRPGPRGRPARRRWLPRHQVHPAPGPEKEIALVAADVRRLSRARRQSLSQTPIAYRLKPGPLAPRERSLSAPAR